MCPLSCRGVFRIKIFKTLESCSFDELRALVTRHCQGPSFHNQGGPAVLDGMSPHPGQGEELADGGLEHSTLGEEVAPAVTI